MISARQLGALAAIDRRILVRDSMLRWIVFLPLILAGVLRFAIPALDSSLALRSEVHLADYYTLVMSALALMLPNILGMVTGFVLLDQRDDRTLMALQVTPIPSGITLLVRFLVPVAAGIAVTPLILLVAAFAPVQMSAAIMMAVSAALLGPLFALSLASFARNKVQGLALAKAAGVFILPAIGAWFVASPVQLAFGILPTYWPMKVYWMVDAGEAGAWKYALVGIAYQCVLLALVKRRFDRVTRS